jgi:uncharacterized protein involved in type VI secretion and phage assembly
MNAEQPRYFGKYRGTVVNTHDPELLARLQAAVPDVLGTEPTTWAMPSVPCAGPGAGVVALPPVGAGVWIEFEQGDPDYPIWSGCFWGSAAEMPVLTHLSPPGLSSLTFQTTLQNGMVINDVPGPAGGIILKSATGAAIIVNDTGIYISNGKGAMITLVGPTVTVNVSALVIT